MPDSFYDVVNRAVEDIAEHGYDGAERLAFWQQQIREAAATTLTPVHVMEQTLRESLESVYRKMIERGQIAKLHPGVGRFTIDKLRPRLRAELDRRILAAADLIRLNREQAVDQTLRRFAGWSTSIPIGGSAGDVAEIEARQQIKKSLKQMPFEARRVLIDQGHKLSSSLSEIIAKDGNAIAGIWHSHYRQPGYNYREDHKERDGKVYFIRGSWPIEKGFVIRDVDYYDEITAAGYEVFCRCYITWIYTLGRLPTKYLSQKGRDALAGARAQMRATA